ncbi:unnamed protein product [Linum trigynum]|uniref:Uncharacterized protein n=1 Tax=Linum trigynum TaxID=586398 RepID=A0AAV2CQZ6_9ROSI
MMVSASREILSPPAGADDFSGCRLLCVCFSLVTETGLPRLVSLFLSFLFGSAAFRFCSASRSRYLPCMYIYVIHGVSLSLSLSISLSQHEAMTMKRIAFLSSASFRFGIGGAACFAAGRRRMAGVFRRQPVGSAMDGGASRFRSQFHI